jgi:hypothetical protein
MLVTPLADDEPRDIAWVYAHLDNLAKRWATLNPQYKANTTITYMSRAKAALDDYLAWYANPTTFRFKDRAARQPRSKQQQSPPSSAPVAGDGVLEGTWEPVKRSTVENALRIGPDREFRFSMPHDVNIAEVRRIAAHLATYATDWEAGSAIVRAES